MRPPAAPTGFAMSTRLDPHTTAAGAAPAAAGGTPAPGTGELVIGKVASPPRRESTSEEFCFWIAPETLVEKSQIVRTRSTIGGEDIRFYGLVKEVYRQSRQGNLAEEHDRYDGDVTYDPPYESCWRQ